MTHGFDADLVDREARELAITTLDKPLLVEAGAGTGKTTLLVARLVHALAAGAVLMPRVVAITFTEKAAAELRLRLRQGLERAAADTARPVDERTRLGRALHELDRATVSTIHAFAAALLRERPVQARIDPQFRTLDELESAQLFREFWNRWVDAELETDAAAQCLRFALLTGVRLEPDIVDLARDLDLQRDCVEALAPPSAAADLESRMRDVHAAVRRCLAHAERYCREPEDRGFAQGRDLAAQLATLDGLDPQGWPAVFLQDLPLQTNLGRASAWVGQEGAASKQMRREIRAAIESLRQAFADTALHGVLLWLERFRDAYDIEKQRRGVLDFQDLLLRARKLVREDPAVRRELGAGIDMLCVDEFQDTDPLQAELVLFLAERGGPALDWHDVVVGPKLFLVGDPKQSIYRFRRADLDVYARCVDLVTRSGGLRLDIVRNFRSRPAVIDWVNGVFESTFQPAPEDPSAPRHVALVAGPEALDRPAVWIVRHGAGALEAAADAARRAEATALAAFIARALHEAWPVRDAGTVRPLRAADIALLFARTSGIELYETALRTAGIAFQQEGGRLFFQRPEVRDVLHTLAAIDDPHDELALVAALRSPLFGITDEELLLHRLAFGGFVSADPAVNPALAEPLAIVAALHAARHTNGVAGTIAALLDRTSARAAQAARPQGAQALANFEMLQRRARQFEATHAAGLREFIRALQDLDRDTPRIAEWAPQDDADDRVRLLTVHMAKGLEFPCVLLANMGARASGQTSSVLVERLSASVSVRLRAGDIGHSFKSATWDEVSVRDRDRDAAEERRLLYVAATRARDYLVVPAFEGAASGGFARLLREVPGALGDAPCGALPAPAEPGAFVPRDVPWCRIEAADLPIVVPAVTRRAARTDVELLWRRRDEWRLRHAAQLRGGGAGEASQERLPVGEELGDVPRWRLLLGRALESIGGDPSPSAIESGVRRVTAAHGARLFASELRELAPGAIAFDCAQGSRRIWRGVTWVGMDGARPVSLWLDCIHDTPDGLLLVEYVLEASDVGLEAARAVVRWKAAVLRSAPVQLARAGILCLPEGTWHPAGESTAL